jgi:carbon-monoxide dehydrogenase large subunit
VSFTAVGKPFGHIEGPAKVTGAAAYTADLRFPATIWGKSLRSPLPHARIVGVNTSAARRLPGVLAVITAADLPDILTGKRLQDMPILARDRVRFVGERVALVAAEDADLAEEALSQIEVEYQELPAVFDPLEAVQEGAPIIHENMHSYRGLPHPPSGMRNVCSHGHWTLGDIEVGFREADEIFEHRFSTQHVHQGYLEPHAGVVAIGDDGRVHLWMNNKVPYNLKELFSQSVGLSPEKIVVHLSYIGGDFGGSQGEKTGGELVRRCGVRCGDLSIEKFRPAAAAGCDHPGQRR